MRKFRYLVIWPLTTIGLAILQIIWNGYLPSPANQCQIIFAGLTIWLMFSNNKIKIFWTLLIVYWIFDLLSSAPAGINSVSVFITFIVLTQLLTRVLTSHSIGTAIIVSALGISIFRTVYLTIGLISGFIQINQLFGQGTLMMEIFWEIILTTVFATIIFISAMVATRRFNPRYILMDNKIMYD